MSSSHPLNSQGQPKTEPHQCITRILIPARSHPKPLISPYPKHRHKTLVKPKSKVYLGIFLHRLH